MSEFTDTLSPILDFWMDAWKPLGGALRLKLHRECTVLVGRNGAGKSALCDGFVNALNDIHRSVHSGPRRFGMRILTADKVLTYEHSWHVDPAKTEKGLLRAFVDEEKHQIWRERCAYEGDSAPLWEISDEGAHMGGQPLTLPPTASMVTAAFTDEKLRTKELTTLAVKAYSTRAQTDPCT